MTAATNSRGPTTAAEISTFREIDGGLEELEESKSETVININRLNYKRRQRSGQQ
ncbi:hypothetical protein QQF64_019519, partial [Cirrhinus molitorella]